MSPERGARPGYCHQSVVIQHHVHYALLLSLHLINMNLRMTVVVSLLAAGLHLLCEGPGLEGPDSLIVGVGLQEGGAQGGTLRVPQGGEEAGQFHSVNVSLTSSS